MAAKPKPVEAVDSPHVAALIELLAIAQRRIWEREAKE